MGLSAIVDSWNAIVTHDVLYAVQSLGDYDPEQKLEAIIVPLVAVNSADDLLNPPDLGILEKQIKPVKHGKAVLIPQWPDTARAIACSCDACVASSFSNGKRRLQKFYPITATCDCPGTPPGMGHIRLRKCGKMIWRSYLNGPRSKDDDPGLGAV